MLAIRLGCACLLWGTAAAQVFVVDASNGPGTHIVGEGTVRLDRSAGTVAFGPTAPGQVVVLRNVELPGTTTNVTDARGPVVLEQCRRAAALYFFGRSDLALTRSANVQVHECALGTASAGSASPPFVAAITATDSVVLVSRTQIAALGGSPAIFLTRGTDGNPGIALVRSRCVVVESTILGGRGGVGCRTCGIGCSADGGHGGPAWCPATPRWSCSARP